MHRRLITALTGAGALALSLVLTSPALAQSKPAETPVCAKCHEQSHASIALTAHGARNDASGRMCQACHGDATEHLKDPTKAGMPNRFAKKLPGDDRSQICLGCHDGHRQLAFWDSGKHRKNDVACSDCHNIHGKPANPSVSPFVTTQRTLQYETCNTCHKNIRAQINRTSHHPIVEGKVTCSDCHNPHGALSHAMVKNESVNQLCIDCHGDKRGPFIWEHAPVEENCLSCHNAHGSNHAKLLNEKVPNLCQDCHDWSRHPGTFYGGNNSFVPGTQNTRFLARGCINCHQMIHGSNAPGNRGKFFTR